VNFYFSNFTLDHGLIAPWIVGVGMFVCTFIYMYTWVYTGEAASKRIRERYLKAILRQDIAFFDKVGPGEVTTRIQTDTRTWLFTIPIPLEVSTADTAYTQIWSIRVYLRRLPSPSAFSLHSLPVSSWHIRKTGDWLWL
jgi:ABC transporter transmembrane region